MFDIPVIEGGHRRNSTGAHAAIAHNDAEAGNIENNAITQEQRIDSAKKGYDNCTKHIRESCSFLGDGQTDERRGNALHQNERAESHTQIRSVHGHFRIQDHVSIRELSNSQTQRPHKSIDQTSGNKHSWTTKLLFPSHFTTPPLYQ